MYLLREFPAARLNYDYLYAYYLREFLWISLDEADIHKIGKAGVIGSVHRVRAKIANEEGLFPFPDSHKEMEAEWRKAIKKI